MLPVANRLREGKDFARTTKTGVRATSPSLVLYVLNNFFSDESSFKSHLINQPRVGLIVNKSVGGSVVRHRVSRQLRHLIAQDLFQFPKNSTIVIRVLKKRDIYSMDLASCISSIKKKSPVLL